MSAPDAPSKALCELNDLLTGWADAHGLIPSDHQTDDATHAAAGILSGNMDRQTAVAILRMAAPDALATLERIGQAPSRFPAETIRYAVAETIGAES
jgi:hypothetical protein